MELLGGLGYDYLHGTVIAHDGENPERANYQEALLQNILSDSVRRINPDVPAFAQAEAVKEIQRIHSPELLANNERFHRMLTFAVSASSSWLNARARTPSNSINPNLKFAQPVFFRLGPQNLRCI